MGVIEAMKGRPSAEVVYLNEEGGYIFFAHPSHPIEKTRSEILGEETEVKSKKSKN